MCVCVKVRMFLAVRIFHSASQMKTFLGYDFQEALICSDFLFNLVFLCQILIYFNAQHVTLTELFDVFWL